MEGRKQSGYSSSTSGLFGSRESSSASSYPGIYGSHFAPPSEVLGRESVRPDVVEKKQDPAYQDRNTKAAEKSPPTSEAKNISTPKKKSPDVYSQPQNTQSSGYTTFSKNVGEDDSGYASRGNWWQGSLYY